MSWLSDLWDTITGKDIQPGMSNLNPRVPAINRSVFTGEPVITGSPSPPRPGSLNNILQGGFSTAQGAFQRAAEQIAKSRPQTDPLQDLMARLEMLQDPSRYLMDEGSLRAQARAAANAQYDPIIAQLRQQRTGSEQRAGRQKDELGQMFSQLSGSLESDMPKIAQQFQGTKQATQAAYDQTQKSIQDQYAQSQAEQEAMYKRLNIEAAAPGILPEQQRDRDYFVNLSKNEAQTQQSALGMEQTGAEEFTRKGSQIARTEGTQRQANLMDELRQMLAAYDSQIGAHEAAKTQAEIAGYGDLVNQMQIQAMQRSQRDFENAIKSIQLGQSLNKTNQFPTSVQSLSDVSGRGLGMGLQQSQAQDIQNVFAQALSSDPSILAGMNESGAGLTKEALAQRIVEAGRQQGLSPQQINALQVMALEYFGRGR